MKATWELAGAIRREMCQVNARRSRGHAIAVDQDSHETHLAVGTAHGERQLSGHTQRVTYLRLAGAKLAKDLGDGLGLDAPCARQGHVQDACMPL